MSTVPDPEKVSFLVRLSKQQREDARALAERFGMSVNEYILQLLKQADAMEQNDLNQAKEFPQPGEIKLVTVPDTVLYDTQHQINPHQWPKATEIRLATENADVVFFQNPAGRPLSYTNVLTAGSLTWPKRMSIYGMSIQFDREIDPCKIKEMVLELIVGDQVVKEFPLPLMINEGLKFSQKWDKPVWLPSVQMFAVKLRANGNWIGETELRATIIGDLYRESF